MQITLETVMLYCILPFIPSFVHFSVSSSQPCVFSMWFAGMKVSNQVHAIMGYKLSYGAYSSTMESIRSVKQRGSAMGRGAKKGKSPVESFQRKLVVFGYVILQSIIWCSFHYYLFLFQIHGGSIAPKRFTRNDSLIILRGMTPEILIDATKEEV